MKKIIFTIVFVLFIVLMFWPSYKALREKKVVVGAYEAQIEELKAKKIQLIEESRRLEEDPSYLEGIARDKMGLLKEGEVRYKIE